MDMMIRKSEAHTSEQPDGNENLKATNSAL